MPADAFQAPSRTREVPDAAATTPSRAAPEKIAVNLRSGSSVPVNYDPAQDNMGRNPIHHRTDEDDGTVGLQSTQATAGHLAAFRKLHQDNIAKSNIAQDQYVASAPVKTTPGMQEYAAAGGAGVSPTTNLGVPDATAHPADPSSAKPPSTPIQRAVEAQRANPPSTPVPSGTATTAQVDARPIPVPSPAPVKPPAGAVIKPATPGSPEIRSGVEEPSPEPKPETPTPEPKDVSSAHEGAAPAQAV